MRIKDILRSPNQDDIDLGVQLLLDKGYSLDRICKFINKIARVNQDPFVGISNYYIEGDKIVKSSITYFQVMFDIDFFEKSDVLTWDHKKCLYNAASKD